MDDLSKLKVAELKKKCKELGLSPAGNKTEIISRLQSKTNEAELLELDNSGYSKSLDTSLDEAVLLGEETSDKATESTTVVLATQTSSNNDQETIKSEEPPAKTVKLNDKVPSTVDETETSKTLSDEEKRVLRAERFGMKVEKSAEEKKQERAARFGLTGSNDTKVPVDVDKLKERAQRFGVTVSKHLINADIDDKKRKRAERFGIDTAAISSSGDASSITTNGKGVDAEKLAKRAERFGVKLSEDEEKKKAARAARFGLVK